MTIHIPVWALWVFGGIIMFLELFYLLILAMILRALRDIWMGLRRSWKP